MNILSCTYKGKNISVSRLTMEGFEGYEASVEGMPNMEEYADEIVEVLLLAMDGIDVVEDEQNT